MTPLSTGIPFKNTPVVFSTQLSLIARICTKSPKPHRIRHFRHLLFTDETIGGINITCVVIYMQRF
jgi:hypothetical protein